MRSGSTFRGRDAEVGGAGHGTFFVVLERLSRCMICFQALPTHSLSNRMRECDFFVHSMLPAWNTACHRKENETPPKKKKNLSASSRLQITPPHHQHHPESFLVPNSFTPCSRLSETLRGSTEAKTRPTSSTPPPTPPPPTASFATLIKTSRQKQRREGESRAQQKNKS